jgi:hypothetical protein
MAEESDNKFTSCGFSSDLQPVHEPGVGEVVNAINELTKELREVRVALNAITEIFEDVVEKGASGPSYVRTGGGFDR